MNKPPEGTRYTAIDSAGQKAVKFGVSAYPDTLDIFAQLEEITGESRSLLVRCMADLAGRDPAGFAKELEEYKSKKQIQKTNQSG